MELRCLLHLLANVWFSSVVIFSLNRAGGSVSPHDDFECDWCKQVIWTSSSFRRDVAALVQNKMAYVVTLMATVYAGMFWAVFGSMESVSVTGTAFNLTNCRETVLTCFFSYFIFIFFVFYCLPLDLALVPPVLGLVH